MTEHEAQVFAARLTRVWNPGSPLTVEQWGYRDNEPARAWHFSAVLRSEFELQFYTNEWGAIPFIRLDYQSAGAAHLIPIMCTDFDRKAGGVVHVHVFDKDEGNPGIAAQQMPSFRRGCWLSGCPLEASAHEKAEWMQGFTREEIEAWKLK